MTSKLPVSAKEMRSPSILLILRFWPLFPRLLVHYTFPHMKKVAFDNLTQSEQGLLHAARRAMEGAYNPYSRFFVGAALLMKDGSIVTGCNCENASFALTICAERAAIARAFSDGQRIVKQFAIIGRGATAPLKDVISPCGMCRQMMFECSQLTGHPISVLLASTEMHRIVVTNTDELLPLGFGPRTLGLNVDRFR